MKLCLKITYFTETKNTLEDFIIFLSRVNLIDKLRLLGQYSVNNMLATTVHYHNATSSEDDSGYFTIPDYFTKYESIQYMVGLFIYIIVSFLFSELHCFQRYLKFLFLVKTYYITFL